MFQLYISSKNVIYLDTVNYYKSHIMTVKRTFQRNAIDTSKPASLLPKIEMPHFLQPVIPATKEMKNINTPIN